MRQSHVVGRRVIAAAGAAVVVLIPGACSSSASTVQHGLTQATVASKRAVGGYPRPCGKHTDSFSPLGLGVRTSRTRLVPHLNAFSDGRKLVDRLPSDIKPILELFERTQTNAPKPFSLGAFIFGESRFLQRSGRPRQASFYAVPTRLGAVCYAIGPPVIVNQCVESLQLGISLEFSNRDRLCPDSFVADGLAANDVTGVEIKVGSTSLSARVRRNSFFTVIPSTFSPSDVHSLTVLYKDKPPHRFPIRLEH